MKSVFPLLACAAVAAVALAEEYASSSWGYKTSDEFYGPEEWSKHVPTCGGARQSPINIHVPKDCDVDDIPLQFAGSCDQFQVQYTEESYKIKSQGGSCTVSKDGVSFSLAQFHIHAPSEHTIKGKKYDGEVHFVHSNADGSALTVIGMFLKKSSKASTDPFLSTVWDALDNVDEEAPVNVTLSSYVSLLQGRLAKGHAFNYAGSLTTPNCTEIVDWWVLSKPLKVSEEDFKDFQSYLATLPATDGGKGARPVQPLNGREISVYK